MYGRRIKLYRLEKGLTKKELAKMLAITPKMLTMFEDDERTPDLATARKIADALDVRFVDLVNVPPHQHYQHFAFFLDDGSIIELR